jgi:uncharacterized protein YggE
MNLKRAILLTVLAIIFIPGVCLAQTEEDKLQVAGKASLKAIPENFNIMIPVEEEDSLYETCSTRLIQKFNKIQDELVKNGIEKDLIKTTNFSISENYVFENGQRVKKGYLGIVQLQIIDSYTSPILGKIIKVLKDNQALYSLNFELSESQKETLNKKAITNAVEDAKNKAELIAKVSGVSLKRILKITYNFDDFESRDYASNLLTYEKRVYGEGVSSARMLDNFELSPKEITIEKKILIEWKIEE